MDRSQMFFSLLIIVGFIFTVPESVEAVKKQTPKEAQEWRRDTQSLFNAIDDDKNGVIDVEDWMRPVKDYAKSIGSKTLDESYVRVQTAKAQNEIRKWGDANGDGKVTFDEFYRDSLIKNGFEV